MLRRASLMLVVLGLFVSTGFLWSATGRGQTKIEPESTVKPTVKITTHPVPASANPSSPFSEAAGKNVMFRNELSWTFGGKEQRGWSLYDLLIGKDVRYSIAIRQWGFCRDAVGMAKAKRSKQLRCTRRGFADGNDR
jgi:hypothetical protein